MVEYSEPVTNTGPIKINMASVYTSSALQANGLSSAINQTVNGCMPAAVSLSSNSVCTLEDDGPCAECGEEIIDRFYLYALERRWHNSCLRCYVCRRHLESEGSCYVKDGLIYCKEDYFRRFGAQKCAHCYDSIQSGEMVMRAQANIYHVKCFTCTVCCSLLQTGDHFGIFDNNIYCRQDFEQLQYTAAAVVGLTTADPSSSQFNSNRISSSVSPASINMISSSCSGGSTSRTCLNGLQPNDVSPVSMAGNNNYEDSISFAEYPPPLSHPDFSHNGQTLTTPPSKTQRGQRKRRQQGESAHRRAAAAEHQWQLGMSIVDPDAGYHHTGSQSHQHVKQKRMRTSFKHHQLKIMKQYFTLNHNPDAKDLKQLSQKTGLSKRVLQVWFQNARAKYRRGQGEGGKDDNNADGEDNSPNDEEHDSNDEMLSDMESIDEPQSNASGSTSVKSHADDALITGSPLDILHRSENTMASSLATSLTASPAITMNQSEPTLSLSM